MKLAFMLDTDSVSLAIRGKGHVGERLLRQARSTVAISTVVLAELRFGADRVGSAKLHQLISTFASNVEVLPFDEAASDTYGRVATDLEKKGENIGTTDTYIAAHALSRGLVLVTNNLRHFSRVRGLKAESWS